MPDLPDLPTSNISFIAYWNAIDDGEVTGIDPETALSDPNINEYTIYDNGIDIDSYTTVTGREAQARIKTDGWVIAWFDQTADYKKVDSLSKEPPRGPWELANSPWQWSVPDLNNHTLERVIHSLQSNLDKSAGILYTDTDVGLYYYEDESADAVTFMASSAQTTKTCGFSYTSNTTVLTAALTSINDHRNWCYVDWDSPLIAETERIVDGQLNAGNDSQSAIDLQAQGLIPDPNTEYTVTLSSDTGDDPTMAVIMVIWKDGS